MPNEIVLANEFELMHLPNGGDNVFAKCWSLCISLMARLTLFHLAYAARRVPTNSSRTQYPRKFIPYAIFPQIHPGAACPRKFIRGAWRVPANSFRAACSGKFIRHTRYAASLQTHPGTACSRKFIRGTRRIPTNSSRHAASVLQCES